MPQLIKLDVEGFGRALRGRPGLIVGASAFFGATYMGDLAQSIGAAFRVEKDGNYLSVADRALANGTPANHVRDEIRRFVGAARPAVPKQLVTHNWAAVLSGTLDSHFEDALRRHAADSASAQQIAVLSDPGAVPPPRQRPVFKLLGLATRDDFCFTRFGYAKHKNRWTMGVKAFSDLVRGLPSCALALQVAHGCWLTSPQLWPHSWRYSRPHCSSWRRIR
jgi:hypothetical protein